MSYKIIQDHTDLTSTENLESTKEVHRKDTGRTQEGPLTQLCCAWVKVRGSLGDVAVPTSLLCHMT